MSDGNVAIIGSGQMARVLVAGLLSKGYFSENIWVSGRNQDKLNYIKGQFAVNVSTDNKEAVKMADIVVLAVKPHDIPELCAEIATVVHEKKPTVVSIAAGIRLASLHQWLGANVSIVRAMPNTPIAIQAGVTVLCADSAIESASIASVESLFRAVGIVLLIQQEDQLDIVTAISGSGPAYHLLLTEILKNVAVKLGLDPEIAVLLTTQTAFGTASLALQSEFSVEELRAAVTSPKGATEAALNVMTENGISDIVEKAVNAAIQRVQDMNKNMQIKGE